MSNSQFYSFNNSKIYYFKNYKKYFCFVEYSKTGKNDAKNRIFLCFSKFLFSLLFREKTP